MRKKWVFGEYNKDKCASLAEECGISAFSALILYSRGFDTPQKINGFLSPSGNLGDPYSLKDMDKAVNCINAALERGDRICVYGDYDADGVSATAVLYSYLDAMGADVVYYIPERTAEGYGLHADAVEKIADGGAELIITVDTGINAFEAAQKAKQIGISLVITDHHQPMDTLPEALAVVDPHRSDDNSDLDYLAGVGVAFKLICALQQEDHNSLPSEYVQYVALGTIADIMPLVGENRIIVTAGLEAINSNPAPGIAALCETAGLLGKKLNSGHVAYGLAPRINAAGRMGSADSALKLLLSETDETSAYYAAELEEKNKSRYAAEAVISEEITNILNEDPSLKNDNIIVVSGKGWHEGVIGIAASRVVDTYGKPCVVICDSGNGTAKGSCRSTADFSIYKALEYCSDILTNFGGHTLAAGCGLESDRIDEFRKKINEYAAANIPGFSSINISCKINPSGVSDKLLYALEQLEPFGAGNPKPLFAFCGMNITGIRPIGGGKHIRLELHRNSTALQAVKFGVSDKEFPFAVGDTVDIAAVVEKNEYNGKTVPSVQIKDIRYSGTDDEKLFRSYFVYRKIESGVNLSEIEKQYALPSRKLIADVYKCIRASEGINCTDEYIRHTLGLDEKYMCRISVCINALGNRNLIYGDNGFLHYVPNAPKADLTQVPVLRLLGYSG